MTLSRIERIHDRLTAALAPSALEIVDESHLHVGHPGARDGRGHFRVRIVSERFRAHQTLQRHRMVYDALGNLLETDIHALGITALTPGESGEAPAGS